ncbi:MAG: glycosyltransferase [Methanobacterium sp.]
MKIENPKICIPTQKINSSDTTINSSLDKYKLLESTLFFTENTKPLSNIYNLAIEKAIKENVDCLILVHDDVILEENPIPKLEKLFDDYDLVGVAGPSRIELTSPALWHLMGGGFQGGHLHGCVQHKIIKKFPMGMEVVEKPKSNFGPYPHRVVMIDGVFMALNRYAIETMRFDENCPSAFHFYDILNSIDFHLKGGKVGVGDILITHESPGLREFTNDWLIGEQYFLNKYK